ncbi:uncharacterized protein LACBIDRAFT_333788 [Laccaria bicolor S238N-H82]|uniref:Predicted protein n=1 Tax=Laccaria bicolor (strain S238N-H82 / ATCC MYA-4686) TaxID=486041 RepID=B0DX35_LACBS|nr:uncharacterized protein LACBIDRAFT_333788 [Laccaria bicolor S238N-H82]EDR00858.1 predicted protein [Laccaria bicolor S238N-H82]|eukprot:XP_001888452.1 predicted protein [Laccaria bicolor S238N-H82]
MSDIISSSSVYPPQGETPSKPQLHSESGIKPRDSEPEKDNQKSLLSSKPDKDWTRDKPRPTRPITVIFFEWLGRLLLATLCLLTSFLSLWFACKMFKASDNISIWTADYKSPPLPPGAPLLDVFVAWPEPMIECGVKLFLVVVCSPIVIVWELVIMVLFFSAAIGVLSGMPLW